MRELLRGFDANDGDDARGLETPPRVAQILLHGGDIEPVAELVGPRDGEVDAL